MSKNEIKSDNYVSIIIILPSCYGNFRSISTICRDCDVKEKCEDILPPKEPLWCNNP
ncbi:MAG: hypothetical protein ACFE94_07070 [Candidatus Hodarchaeota archaeon]